MNNTIEILLQTPDHQGIAGYDNMDRFIKTWRFWYSSGKENEEEERIFIQCQCFLERIDEDEARFQIKRNGLEITFIYHKDWILAED